MEKWKLLEKNRLDGIIKELQNADFTVKDVKKGSRSRKSPVPFITSTLQQEASKNFEFFNSKKP